VSLRFASVSKLYTENHKHGLDLAIRKARVQALLEQLPNVGKVT